MELNCKNYRRWGVEIELNTPSGEAKSLGKNVPPEGAIYVAHRIQATLAERVEIHGWHTTNNNRHWVIKPDSSCGMEVCTPLQKGWHGLRQLLQVLEVFENDPLISADARCSLHVHLNVGDLVKEQISRIVAYWIKCEAVFMDAFPGNRKINRYCQFIGLSNSFSHDWMPEPETLLTMISDTKYYSLNTYHYHKNNRKAIEARLADHSYCRNAFKTKMWVRFLLHFIECALAADYPRKYKKDDPWTGLLWLDPLQVFEFLRFNQEISPGLTQVRSWFLQELVTHIHDSAGVGIFSVEARSRSLEQIRSLIHTWGMRSDDNYAEALYSERYVV